MNNYHHWNHANLKKPERLDKIPQAEWDALHKDIIQNSSKNWNPI
jgi:hypothetical protein